jgi:hypothetical protein
VDGDGSGALGVDDEEEEEEVNPMEALEKRTLESKREIEALDALDELRSINARHEKLGRDDVAAEHLRDAADDDGARAELDEDEELVRSIFRTDGGGQVRRLADDDDDDDDGQGRDPGLAAEDDDDGGAGGGAGAVGTTARLTVVPGVGTVAAPSRAVAKAAPRVHDDQDDDEDAGGLSSGPLVARPPVAVRPPPPKKAKLSASALGIVVKKKPAP